MFNASKCHCQVIQFGKKDCNKTVYYVNGQRLLTVSLYMEEKI